MTIRLSSVLLGGAIGSIVGLLIFAYVPMLLMATPATTTEPEPEPETQPETQPETEPEPEPEPTAPLTDEEKAAENAEQAVESNDDINPCLLGPDPSCPKPGPDQDCPEGYAQNEDGECFLLHPQGCPGGYHGHEDDESGYCIPNSTPCMEGYEFNEDKTNCDKEHFTCDGKPSVVPCDERKEWTEDDAKKHSIIRHFHDTKIIHKVLDADDNIDVDQTIVAISYEEGKGLNCVIENDNDGQCETFNVTVDKGKEPLLAVIPFQ